MPLTRIESINHAIRAAQQDHLASDSIPSPEQVWRDINEVLSLLAALSDELVAAESSKGAPATSGDYRCNDGHQFHDALAGGVESVIFCAKCGEIRPLESPSRNHAPRVINNTVVQQ